MIIYLIDPYLKYLIAAPFQKKEKKNNNNNPQLPPYNFLDRESILIWISNVTLELIFSLSFIFKQKSISN